MLSKNISISGNQIQQNDVHHIASLLLHMPLISREFINFDIEQFSIQSELSLFGGNGFQELFNNFETYLQQNFQLVFPGDIVETISKKNLFKFTFYLQQNLMSKVSFKNMKLILEDPAPFYFLYLITKHQRIMQNNPQFTRNLQKIIEDILERLAYKNDFMGHSLDLLSKDPILKLDYDPKKYSQEVICITNSKDLLAFKNSFNAKLQNGTIIQLPDKSYILFNKQTLKQLHAKLIEAVDANQVETAFLKALIKNLFLIMIDLQLKQKNRNVLNSSLKTYQKRLNVSYENFVASNQQIAAAQQEDKKNELHLKNEEVASMTATPIKTPTFKPNKIGGGIPPRNKSLFALFTIIFVGTGAAMASFRNTSLEIEPESIDQSNIPDQPEHSAEDLLVKELELLVNIDQNNYRFLKPIEVPQLFEMEYYFDRVLDNIYRENFVIDSKVPEDLYSQPVGADQHQIKKYHQFFRDLDELYLNHFSPLLVDNKLDPFWYDQSNSFSYLPTEKAFNFIKEYSNHHHQLSDLEAIKLSLLVNLFCEKVDLNPAMALGLMATESSFNPKVIGGLGEYGLGQILPSNISTYGMNPDNALNIFLNTRASIYHLYRGFISWQRRTDDRQLLALASYNAGVGAIDRIVARNRNHRSIDYYAPKIIRLQQEID